MAGKPEAEQAKRVIVSQSEFPNAPLEQVLKLPQAIWDNFAGKGAPPMRVAMALGVTPTSGSWRNLCGSSIAYGLTEGGYNASEINLTPLGLKIVRPTDDSDEQDGLRESVLKPRIQREFLDRYNNAKFPKDMIAQNVLADLGLPKERCVQALEILKLNAGLAGVLADIKGEKFVLLAGTGLPMAPSNREAYREVPEQESEAAEQPTAIVDRPDVFRVDVIPSVRRVFITHGKNHKILAQIEKIVRHGGFEPVVAKNNETAAKPVPDKVLDDMRSCQAAVIHVGTDGVLFDADGKEIAQINQNVLIEIGIARASYTKNFILLVEDGLDLPSNLQGLYQCRYSGDSLDMEATFKLLEAFADFRGQGT